MSKGLEVFGDQNGRAVQIGTFSKGTALSGFEEGRNYLIEIPEFGDQLYVDDAPLPLDPQGRYWMWSPGFFSGEVLLELEGKSGSVKGTFRADVSAANHKSGREQFFQYIDDIIAYAPEMVTGTEPATHALGGKSSSPPCAWIRYARLKSFLNPFVDTLRLICDNPMQWNSYRREQLPVHMARRVDVATVRQLASNGELFRALSHKGTAGAEGTTERLPDNRLNVPFYETNLDHPATRVIARQLKAVLRQVSWLISEFSKQGSSVSSETETDISARLPRRLVYLESVRKHLVRLSRREPFSVVSSRDPGVAGINAIAGNPEYNRAHRLGIRLLRDGVSDLQQDERHYLPPTWEIYESWCFVSLAQALEKLLPDFSWTKRRNVSSVGIFLEGERENEKLRLYTQLRCPSLARENNLGYCSISQERRPDLVLEYRYGNHSRFICLDSKYTASKGGLLASMSSAHIYRDSLKLYGAAPIYSLLLAPQVHEAGLLAKFEYINTHQVGCLKCCDENDAVAVARQAIHWLLFDSEAEFAKARNLEATA
ncbi:hypothetical protein PVT68_16105 [Microbulbifer bruguierae]|uniref:DUF2357 domain-containing protein n=1 Tax=Microbulbifer bruguierae TaxID=3029061 RepID=A0ABY8NFL1_9GAMM|nr:nuclease domain-containing protein [Microbulbifer bruguierae]WGL16278.1 hypothetical protein PVT68_16105 [Microbulbifer bruguierae]